MQPFKSLILVLLVAEVVGRFPPWQSFCFIDVIPAAPTAGGFTSTDSLSGRGPEPTQTLENAEVFPVADPRMCPSESDGEIEDDALPDAEVMKGQAEEVVVGGYPYVVEAHDILDLS